MIILIFIILYFNIAKDKSFLDKHHDKLKLILKDLTEKSGSSKV